MGAETRISWCDRTWSPWIGCTKIAPACDGCYAAHLMDTRLGRVEWGPRGERTRTSAGYWRQLAKWSCEAESLGRPITVFPSLCDPFDNRADPGLRAEWFAEIRRYPNLIWFLLSKRPQNAVEMSEAAGGLPPNVALGTTCEDRKRAEINLTALREAADALHPVAFTFASFEPLLDDVGDLSPWLYGPMPLGWAITGGETDQGGHKARPTHPDWFRSIRDQCRRACVPFHHKQNGEHLGGDALGEDRPEFLRLRSGNRPLHVFEDGTVVARVGKRAAGRLLDGVEHNGMPEVRHAG